MILCRKVNQVEHTIDNDTTCSLNENDVVYGYFVKESKELCTGVETPFGKIMLIEGDIVIVSIHRTFKKVNKRWLEEHSKEYVFKAKEKDGDYIGPYELVYYIQNFYQTNKFNTGASIYNFVSHVKHYLTKFVQPIDQRLFIKTPKGREYTEEDIHVRNLEAGKRYKKLVFVRQLGVIITRLFFQDEKNGIICGLWGYSNHTLIFHARNTIINLLFYDQLSDIIQEIFNDRRLWPELFVYPAPASISSK